MNLKIIRSWLAYELVISYIILTRELPIRDFISRTISNKYLDPITPSENSQSCWSQKASPRRKRTFKLDTSTKGQRLSNRINQNILCPRPLFPHEVREQPSVLRYNWNNLFFKLALVLPHIVTLWYLVSCLNFVTA